MGMAAFTRKIQKTGESFWLPFDMPDKHTLRSSSKKLFANYFIAHPISLDNQDSSNDYWKNVYLNPQYSSGSSSAEPYWFAAHGGAYRDRPIGRAPILCSNDPTKNYTCWQLEDMKKEVHNAISAGLDGFELDLLSASGSTNWKYAEVLIDAATLVDPGFKIILTPDNNSTYWGNLDAATMAGSLKYFAVGSDGAFKPSIYVDPYNKAVISPFPTEKIQSGGTRSLDYWQDVKDEFAAITGGLEIAVWAQLSDYTYSKIASNFTNLTKPYTESPMYDAVTYWGHAKASTTIVSTAKLRADIAHGLDDDVVSVDSEGGTKKWIQPLHVTDQRPIKHEDMSGNGKYDESSGTKVLRDQWQAAINYADHAQFITWNDFSETAVSPSVGHGWGYLDLSAYYLVRFKTGSYPTIKRDTIYLTHRSQLVNATYQCSVYETPQIPCALLMESTDGTIADFDFVETTVFLTQSATLEVSVGGQTYTYALDAGMQVVTSPLSVGTVSARILRNSQVVTSVASPYAVSDSPTIQDMQFHIVSSLRK